MATKYIEFEKLPKALQDDAITQFLESFELDWDWYTDIIEERCSFYYDNYGMDIDADALTFDTYRNEMELKGRFNLEHKSIELPEIIQKLEEETIVFDLDVMFDYSGRGDFIDEAYIGSDIDMIESEIAVNGYYLTDLMDIDEQYEIKQDDFDALIDGVKKFIEKFGLDASDYEVLLNALEDHKEMAYFSLSDSITIQNPDLYDIANSMLEDAENSITEIFEDFANETLGDRVEMAYDDIKKVLFENYDWYYSEEHARESLIDREIEVDVDEETNEPIEVISIY